MTTPRPPLVDRMTPWQRLIHAAMLLSVLLLVLSGLALAYHEHGWARSLIAAMGGMEGRTLVHRFGAVLLILAGLAHVASLTLSAKYQRDVRETIPTLADARAGWSAFVYRLTGRGELPRYGRFTPMQKFQTWGMFLGCLIMGVSGAVLWSPRASLELFPKRFMDLMFVVHSSQAQLIFIVFILWHLYDVHVAGGNFPMNPAWLTGKMREDVFKAQHPATWDAMQKGEKE